jgi:hypothetical protein
MERRLNDGESSCAWDCDFSRVNGRGRRSVRGGISNNMRGDMPFGEHPLHSSQLGVALLWHRHGQGIAPHSVRATIEARRGRSQ